MDRAGLVGADGATHCGAFDVAYMACLPNIVCMAPSNEAELINMVATAAAIDDRCVHQQRGEPGHGVRGVSKVFGCPVFHLHNAFDPPSSPPRGALLNRCAFP